MIIEKSYAMIGKCNKSNGVTAILVWFVRIVLLHLAVQYGGCPCADRVETRWVNLKHLDK